MDICPLGIRILFPNTEGRPATPRLFLTTKSLVALRFLHPYFHWPEGRRFTALEIMHVAFYRGDDAFFVVKNYGKANQSIALTVALAEIATIQVFGKSGILSKEFPRSKIPYLTYG